MNMFILGFFSVIMTIGLIVYFSEKYYQKHKNDDELLGKEWMDLETYKEYRKNKGR